MNKNPYPSCMSTVVQHAVEKTNFCLGDKDEQNPSVSCMSYVDADIYFYVYLW